MAKLTLVADENIPLLSELFSSFAQIQLLPGRAIKREHLLTADILLVRSVTSVNQALLANTPVKFVGSATAGIEHVERQWLQQNQIGFADAKGCNATAVAEYVVAVIASLRRQGYLTGTNLQAGVVGIGAVGSQVVTKLAQLGFTVWQNDPPRAENDASFISTPLSNFGDLDLICIHTPLTYLDPHSTYHLFDRDLLKILKPNCILLNAGRGAVINSKDLQQCDPNIKYCFDVWEHEPQIDPITIRNSLVATPHIAGYTKEAKIRATLMLLQAINSAFNLNLVLPAEEQFFPQKRIKLTKADNTWEKVMNKIYDPHLDTKKMFGLSDKPATIATEFDQWRKHYPNRFEFKSIHIENHENYILPPSDLEVLRNLGLAELL